MMGITRKLLNLTIDQFDRDANYEELMAAGIKVFEDLKIKLNLPKKENSETTFSKIVKSSTLNRTQYLMIIQNWEKLWKVLNEGASTRTDHDKV